MKKFVIWLISLILTLGILDALAGAAFKKYISKHTLPGDYETIDKVLRHNDSELLVLGSSVALNSIDNQVIGDSLNLSTFNGGGNGQTFPFFLTLLKAVTSGHSEKPEMILLCVTPGDFSSTGVGNRYNIFVPYYGLNIADVDQNLERIRKGNDKLLNSFSYRLNNIWFRILLYHFISPDIRGKNGHISKPLPPIFPEKKDVHFGKLNDERREELTEFINICRENDIELIILFTPENMNVINIEDPDNSINRVVEIARSLGVKTYVDTELTPFSDNPELFYDDVHININGTTIYTDTVLKRLKNMDLNL